MTEVLYHKEKIIGPKMELHMASDGLVLVGCDGKESVDYAPLGDITDVAVTKRGRRACLTVSFGTLRPAWVVQRLPALSAEWAESVINEELGAHKKRGRAEYTQRVPLDSLTDSCKAIIAGKDNHAAVDLCDFLLVQGVLHEVSDIHFDPYSEDVVVRFRLDGVLRDVARLDSSIKPHLTARLKVISHLATFRKAIAQEGRAALKIDGRTVDFRFSALPTIHGEKIAVRVFDPAKSIFEIADLGMSAKMLADFESMLMQPQGTILLTGPAGSGKTTTMYAALNFLRENRRNLSSIATVEDPVEYDLQVVNQTQVNSASGLTFANALRTVLRQDPEVIMIGEIRDRETADIAVQAGLTGHLILSTVHARSAAGVPLRLVDLGVEPYLLTSSLSAVISQRLVRKVCKSCAGEHTPTSEEVEKLGVGSNEKFYTGRGCAQCGETGYAGRSGVFQLVPISQALRELIMQRCSITEIEAQIERDGTQSLLHDGLAKAKAGITTLEELLRVIG